MSNTERHKRAEDVFFSDDELELAIKYYDVPSRPSEFRTFKVSVKNTFNLSRSLSLDASISIILNYKKHPKIILLIMDGIRKGNIFFKAYNNGGNEVKDIKKMSYLEIYNDDIYSKISKDGEFCNIVTEDDEKGDREDLLLHGISSTELCYLCWVVTIQRQREYEQEQEKLYQRSLKKAESLLE